VHYVRLVAGMVGCFGINTILGVFWLVGFVARRADELVVVAAAEIGAGVCFEATDGAAAMETGACLLAGDCLEAAVAETCVCL